MRERTEDQFLGLLKGHGAHRLRGVRFRQNRTTIWSLTQGGTLLNVHSAYRSAPLPIVRAFAVIARDALRKTPAYREAARVVREWPGLAKGLRAARAAHRRRPVAKRRRSWIPRVGPCCATPAQRLYLRQLYRYLNETRLGGRLPRNIPLRLSRRMTSRLGQMVPGSYAGRRYVVEIALNVDLMLEGNGRERLDTLLHEMAHAADHLFDGGRGHGDSWRAWAERVGCRVGACTSASIRRRSSRDAAVTRVPPLPRQATVLAA